MLVAKLEARLRSLGWVPIESGSVRWRYWKRAFDHRPVPDTIVVPRSLWIAPAEAAKILRKASNAFIR